MEDQHHDPEEENILPESEDQQALESQTTEENEVVYVNPRIPKYKKFIKTLWVFYFIGFLISVVFFYALSSDLPSFEFLENPTSRIASNVYSSDGILLGKFYIENRTPVDYDSLSPHLVNALISTEDARFLSHSGIDAEAIARVIVKTLILQQRNAGGGSTISQQLAKLLVGRPNTKDKGIFTRAWLIISTKLKEWLTAVKLERSYTCLLYTSPSPRD